MVYYQDGWPGLSQCKACCCPRARSGVAVGCQVLMSTSRVITVFLVTVGRGYSCQLHLRVRGRRRCCLCRPWVLIQSQGLPGARLRGGAGRCWREWLGWGAGLVRASLRPASTYSYTYTLKEYERTLSNFLDCSCGIFSGVHTDNSVGKRV